MTIAIWKLQLVARVAFAKALNPWLSVLYLFSTYVWVISFFADIFITIINFDDLTAFVHMRDILICN